MAYKTSKQRNMIIDYMKCINTHVSAETIYAHLNVGDIKISLATIYRNLNILSEMKEIKKIALPDGYVYDKTCKPHYHFYCRECNTLYDLSSAYDQNFDLIADNESMVGSVDGHELTFKGICKNCIKSKRH